MKDTCAHTGTHLIWILYLAQKRSCLQRIDSDETEPQTVGTRTRRDYTMEVYSFTVYFRTLYNVKQYSY